MEVSWAGVNAIMEDQSGVGERLESGGKGRGAVMGILIVCLLNIVLKVKTKIRAHQLRH